MATKTNNIQNILNDYLNEINRLDELFEKNRIQKDVKTSKNKILKADKSGINKLTSLPKLMQKLRNKKNME